MNNEVKKMLIETKKELLEKKKVNIYKIVEEQIWADFIEAMKEGTAYGSFIYSHNYVDNPCANSCDFESDTRVITGISIDKLAARLIKDHIEINGHGDSFKFCIPKKYFNGAMDKAYSESKNKKVSTKKKKVISKNLSRDYYVIDDNTDVEEKR